MAYDILKGGSTSVILVGPVILSSDHITGATGIALTVTISKNGAAFGSPSGAVTEIGSGWYKIAGNTTDSNTAGPIAVHATGAACDPFDGVMAQVVDPTLAIYGVNVVQENQVSNSAITTIKAVQGLAVDGVITTLTNLPAITANWLTAAGIAASALNGKGDWLLASSAPTNFSALAITAGGAITAGTVSDKTGYSLSGTQTFNVTGNITGNLSGSVGSVTAGVTVSTNNDKTGYSLTSAEEAAIADAFLERNVAGGSSAGRLVKEALYTLRNKVDTGAGIVYQVDDVTTAFTFAVTTAAGNPITVFDPT